MSWVVGLALAYFAGAISAVFILAFFNFGSGVNEKLEQRDLKALKTRRRKKNATPTPA
jgi:hypothetical protein